MQLTPREKDKLLIAMAAEVARKHGFTEVTHTVEIFGLCSRCGALSSDN